MAFIPQTKQRSVQTNATTQPLRVPSDHGLHPQRACRGPSTVDHVRPYRRQERSDNITRARRGSIRAMRRIGETGGRAEGKTATPFRGLTALRGRVPAIAPVHAGLAMTCATPCGPKPYRDLADWLPPERFPDRNPGSANGTYLSKNVAWVSVFLPNPPSVARQVNAC